MSTSYDIHCVTCGIDVPDWRDATKKVSQCPNTELEDHRDGGTLEQLLTYGRPSLETLGMLAKDHWQLTSGRGVLIQLVEFFGRHAGHDLEVRDEYGRNWAECVADWARYEAEKLAKKAVIR